MQDTPLSSFISNNYKLNLGRQTKPAFKPPILGVPAARSREGEGLLVSLLSEATRIGWIGYRQSGVSGHPPLFGGGHQFDSLLLE